MKSFHFNVLVASTCHVVAMYVENCAFEYGNGCLAETLARWLVGLGTNTKTLLNDVENMEENETRGGDNRELLEMIDWNCLSFSCPSLGSKFLALVWRSRATSARGSCR